MHTCISVLPLALRSPAADEATIGGLFATRDGPVSALAAHGSMLYVGGGFTLRRVDSDARSTRWTRTVLGGGGGGAGGAPQYPRFIAASSSWLPLARQPCRLPPVASLLNQIPVGRW